MAPRPALGRVLAAVVFVFALASPGRAALITSTTSTAYTFTFNDLSDSSNGAAVGQSLAKVWPGTTVVGAIGLNAYTGDDHAVGMVNSAKTAVLPYTLGTTDGGVWHSGYDGYIVNDTSGQFTITFPAKVYTVSFDFEIFPDGSSETPDLTFFAGATQVFHLIGRKPGTSDPPKGLVAGITLVPTFANSPFSSIGGTEPVAQLLGSYTGVFPDGVQTLTFKDWPQRVGIDNLKVDLNAPAPNPAPASTPTPEPATALVWGMALTAFGIVGRRRWARATPSAA